MYKNLIEQTDICYDNIDIILDYLNIVKQKSYYKQIMNQCIMKIKQMMRLSVQIVNSYIHFATNYDSTDEYHNIIKSNFLTLTFLNPDYYKREKKYCWKCYLRNGIIPINVTGEIKKVLLRSDCKKTSTRCWNCYKKKLNALLLKKKKVIHKNRFECSPPVVLFDY